MRQLANLSAKTAISKHDRKQLSISSRTKLAVTLAAAFAGTISLGLSIAGHARLITGFLSLASFAIAGLCGKDYFLLTKKMIGARTAHLEQHSKTGDEAPTGKAAEEQNTAAPAASESETASAEAAPSKEGE